MEMTLKEVTEQVEATVVCGETFLERTVQAGFASDLMSDVLTLMNDNLLLITGLANIQSVRTAEMADIGQILYVRNKIPTKDMVALAKEQGIVLITTSYSMFKASALLYQAGLQPVY